MKIEIIYCIQDKKASFISRFYGETLDKSLPIAYHRNHHDLELISISSNFRRIESKESKKIWTNKKS